MNLPNNFQIEALDNIDGLSPEELSNLKYNNGIAVIGALNSIACNGLIVYGVCSDSESVELLMHIGKYETEKLHEAVKIVTELPETLPDRYSIVNLTRYY